MEKRIWIVKFTRYSDPATVDNMTTFGRCEQMELVTTETHDLAVGYVIDLLEGLGLMFDRAAVRDRLGYGEDRGRCRFEVTDWINYEHEEYPNEFKKYVEKRYDEIDYDKDEFIIWVNTVSYLSQE